MFQPSDNEKVVEAEFIDEKSEESGKLDISDAANKAAGALDSLAEAVSAVSPEKGAQLAQRAEQIRSAGAAIENVVEDGMALYEHGKKTAGNVKNLLAKVGIEPELVRRGRGPRSSVRD